MNASPQKPTLALVQRIILFVSAIALTTLLFIYRGGINSQGPLDTLARQSLAPEEALANGRPTVFEFYADWCEACRQMAPSMLAIERQIENKVDIVLLNVDNNSWQDLIDEYEVSGIPQLNFFNAQGKLAGKAIGVQSEEKLNKFVTSLLSHEPIPSLLEVGKVSNFNATPLLSDNKRLNNELTQPRSHS